MNRITEKMLQAKVDYLNRVTNNPGTPWTRNGDGKLTANIGNYHIDGAYGGVRLVQHMNKGGGINVILDGFAPKRELFNEIKAMLIGIEVRTEQ